MRQLTISWLVEVADECRMHQETLFLAITLLDRFLSQSTVRKTPPISVFQDVFSQSLLVLVHLTIAVFCIPQVLCLL